MSWENLDRFLRDGRIVTMPSKRAKRLPLLDYIATMSFDIGVRYPEAEVDAILMEYHSDYCALRRYLVEEGFLDRDHNVYWRSGGTVI